MMEYSKKYRWALAGFIVMIILNLLVLGSIWKVRKDRLRDNPEASQVIRLQRFMERQLDLRPEQLRQLQALRSNHRQEMLPLREEIHRHRRKLFNGIGGSDQAVMEANTIDSLTTRIGEAQARLDAAIINHLSEVRALCDANQKQKFDRIIQRVQHRMNRRGK